MNPPEVTSELAWSLQSLRETGIKSFWCSIFDNKMIWLLTGKRMKIMMSESRLGHFIQSRRFLNKNGGLWSRTIDITARFNINPCRHCQNISSGPQCWTHDLLHKIKLKLNHLILGPVIFVKCVNRTLNVFMLKCSSSCECISSASGKGCEMVDEATEHEVW